jgi:hypothetical protein
MTARDLRRYPWFVGRLDRASVERDFASGKSTFAGEEVNRSFVVDPTWIASQCANQPPMVG